MTPRVSSCHGSLEFKSVSARKLVSRGTTDANSTTRLVHRIFCVGGGVDYFFVDSNAGPKRYLAPFEGLEGS